MTYTLRSGGVEVAVASMDVDLAPKVIVRGNAVYLLAAPTGEGVAYDEVSAWWAPETSLRGRESGVL